MANSTINIDKITRKYINGSDEVMYSGDVVVYNRDNPDEVIFPNHDATDIFAGIVNNTSLSGQPAYVTILGEGNIYVTGTIVAGNLLTSAGDGTATARTASDQAILGIALEDYDSIERGLIRASIYTAFSASQADSGDDDGTTSTNFYIGAGTSNASGIFNLYFGDQTTGAYLRYESGTFTLKGNLNVDGTQTVIDTETLTISDNVIVLNSNVTGTPSEDGGIEIERGTSPNASLLWHETTQTWRAGLLGSEIVLVNASSTQAISNKTFTSSTWQGNAIGIGYGGTGISTTPTNGQLLIGNGTGYTLSNITGTANQISIANSAGGITLSLPNDVTISGTMQANVYIGDGSQLTGVSAGSVAAGDITAGTLDTDVLVPSANLQGALPAISGAALTSLNASNLSTGSVSDSLLSGNVALKGSANTFAELNTFTTGATKGIAIGTSTLSQVISGSLSSVRLRPGTTLYNAFRLIPATGTTRNYIDIFGTNFDTDAVNYSNLQFGIIDGVAVLSTTSAGTGTLYDMVFKSNTTERIRYNSNGVSINSRLSLNSTTPPSSGAYLQAPSASITGTCTAGTFSGSGASLTNLNASAITSGELDDAYLSNNVARLDSANQFALDQTISTTGSSSSSLRKLIFSGLLSGEGASIQFGNEWDSIGLLYGNRMLMQSYYGIEISGNRQSGSARSFATGTSADASLSVIGTTTSAPVLTVVSSAGQSANLQEWQNNAGTPIASVDASGNITLPGLPSTDNHATTKKYVDDTIAAINTGIISFTEITTTSETAIVNNGYIANNASLVTINLPATANTGDIIKVVGKGAGGWKIAQGAGQVIYFGESSTSTGTTGYLSSTHQRNCVEIICINNNTQWQVIGSVGTVATV